MFAFQDSRADVDVAFTDRHGGVSGGPYASLNLAESGGDDPYAVQANTDLVAYAFAHEATGNGAFSPPDDGGRRPLVVRMSQVHGSDVCVVGEDLARPPISRTPGSEGTTSQPPIVADGLVTTVPGVILMVRAADCVPVLLADVAQGVVGALHAGRNGMVAGIVANTAAAMRELGARQITGWVGPHVCGKCYEVPEQMRADVTRAVPEAYAETSWGTPALDIGAGVRAQLGRAGASVVDASRCTIEDQDLFSYRRQGKESGRLAGLVWVRP